MSQLQDAGNPNAVWISNACQGLWTNWSIFSVHASPLCSQLTTKWLKVNGSIKQTLDASYLQSSLYPHTVNLASSVANSADSWRASALTCSQLNGYPSGWVIFSASTMLVSSHTLLPEIWLCNMLPPSLHLCSTSSSLFVSLCLPQHFFLLFPSNHWKAWKWVPSVLPSPCHLLHFRFLFFFWFDMNSWVQWKAVLISKPVSLRQHYVRMISRQQLDELIKHSQTCTFHPWQSVRDKEMWWTLIIDLDTKIKGVFEDQFVWKPSKRREVECWIRPEDPAEYLTHHTLLVKSLL